MQLKTLKVKVIDPLIPSNSASTPSSAAASSPASFPLVSFIFTCCRCKLLLY